LPEALEYGERAVAIQRELFGERHPDVAISLSNIGVLYGEQGNLANALEFAQQSLVIRRELFGDRHHSVSRISVKVAQIMLQMHMKSEAYDLVRHVLSKISDSDPSRSNCHKHRVIWHKDDPERIRQPSKKRNVKKKH
jgi:hypothetical protein